MAWVFVEIDRTGRKIHLSGERWSHIQKRPEMAGEIEIIKSTLKTPIKITRYSMDQKVRYYYSYHKYRRSRAKYLRVIVKYINGEGFIITAYYVPTLK